MAEVDGNCVKCAKLENATKTVAIGSYDISQSRGSEEAAAMGDFCTGDFIDAQARVTNGALGTFTIPQGCPWG